MHSKDVLAAVGSGLWQWDEGTGKVTVDGCAAQLLGLLGAPARTAPPRSAPACTRPTTWPSSAWRAAGCPSSATTAGRTRTAPSSTCRCPPTTRPRWWPAPAARSTWPRPRSTRIASLWLAAGRAVREGVVGVSAAGRRRGHHRRLDGGLPRKGRLHPRRALGAHHRGPDARRPAPGSAIGGTLVEITAQLREQRGRDRSIVSIGEHQPQPMAEPERGSQGLNQCFGRGGRSSSVQFGHACRRQLPLSTPFRRQPVRSGPLGQTRHPHQMTPSVPEGVPGADTSPRPTR